MLTRIFVGSDVSSNWFDICFLERERPVIRYDNNARGHARFIQDARERAKKVFICMEHTGGYETALALACVDAGFIVSIVDGAQISSYRKSFGSARAKTDLKDAQLLAKYCKERKPAQWRPVPDEYRILKELVKHRGDLIELRQTASNQASRGSCVEFVVSQRATHLEVLDLQILAVDEEIQTHINATPTLKSDIELLDSIPGIALVSAIRILAETGPISNFATARDYALAAGLAPITLHSGMKTSPGKLPVYGNRNLRNALYFPAVVNLGKQTAVGEFMNRIQGNGHKAKMTVLVAGMRKLAHIVFGVLKSQSRYDPQKT